MFKLTAIYAIILALILLISSGVSLLSTESRIASSGKILVPIAATEAYQSEIRAIFVHAFSTVNPDWNLIAQTSSDYSINVIVVEALGNNFARYPSQYVPNFDAKLEVLISEAHARGIKVYVSMNVMSGVPQDHPEFKCVKYDGTTVDWFDPTNPNAIKFLKSLVEEMVSKLDIDGFMFDYIRYDTVDIPYGEYAKQSFEEYLGENITNWPGDFAPNGTRRNEFMEWRTIPINNLVRDMRNWMLAIKPNLEFSAALWRWPSGAPTYWRYWIGQDSTYWVKEGWLDWVSPMFYTDDLQELEDGVNSFRNIQLGGPEGIIPIVPFIDTCVGTVSTPENFAQRVNKLRELGTDGWIIWRYGGPGDGEGSDAPDIRNYLSIIDLPTVFSLENIRISVDETRAAIIWNTDLPVTSKVEYSTSPLFNDSFKYVQSLNFHYWDIDHVIGTVAEDNTPVTNHNITLTGLLPGTKYYFRVQSEGLSGIATSKAFTFTTTTP